MATIYALTKLFDDVSARFIDDALLSGATPVPNLFGWRRPAQKLTPGDRILWVPGDPRGNVGALGAPRFVGEVSQDVRRLATLDELFTVTIVGFDNTAPTDERKQYERVRAIYDQWVRAVHLAAFGTYRFIGQEWVNDHVERRAGAAVRITASIAAMIPDDPTSTVDANLGALVDASLDVAELDQTEHLTVSAS